MTDLRSWLEAASLADLHDALAGQGVDLDVLGDLTDADLREIGLNVGDRRRLLKAIAAGAAAPADTPAGHSERRQVTVMFVDLVGFTTLAADRDAEDLGEIVAAYNRTCAAVVERHGGTVAKYLGDGILVAFGYPRAEEHAAERAVRAGLGVIAAVEALQAVPGQRLRCRVGAATGTVVAGELYGRGAPGEAELLGEAPNIAARLQAAAEPGTMLIAERTRELIGNLFECRALAPLELKGFPEPVAAHAVLREREVASRYLTAREGRSVPPLEGRATELGQLAGAWHRAAAGQGGAVLLTGEAGIGKSRLTVALSDEVAKGPGLTMALSCQPQFVNTALQPVLSLLRRSAGVQADMPPETQFRRLGALLDGQPGDGPEFRALFAAMLKIPADGLYAPPAESPQRQRQSFFAAMAMWMQAMAQGAPVLLVVEDLQWADPTTREFVTGILDGLAGGPMLLLATTRPGGAGALASDPRVELVRVERLGSEAVEAIVARVVTEGLALPPEVSTLIGRQSDGNPLFAEELTRSLLQSGQLRANAGRLELANPLTRIETPPTLHDSLMARLDRLPAARELAQTGAAIGREFSLDLVAAVIDRPPAALRAAIADLNRAEIVFERPGDGGASFYFKHALIQEAAYDSLLRSRRRELHARIAAAIETRTPDEARLHPEILALHFSRAGDYARAVEFGMLAGLGALTRSANAEALNHIGACLDWLTNLPAGEARDRLELGVNALMTPALMMSRGYASAEVEASARRGLELLNQLGERPEMFASLWGLKVFHHVRSERAQARAVAERFLTLAERLEDVGQQVAGLTLLAQCAWIEGDHAGAEALLRRGIGLYDPALHGHHAYVYGFDSLSYSRITLSQVLWITGRSDEALAEAEAALTHARAINHANTIGMAMLYGMLVRQQRGERAAVAALGAETAAFCERMGVTTPSTYAALVANWAAGDFAASQPIFELHSAIGAELGMTYYRSLAVENALEASDLAAARAILAPALEQAATGGERYWLPQLRRLEAQLALAEGDVAAAAAALGAGAAEAAAMGSHMLEALALADLAALGEAPGATRLAELRGLGVEVPATGLLRPLANGDARSMAEGGM